MKPYLSLLVRAVLAAAASLAASCSGSSSPHEADGGRPVTGRAESGSLRAVVVSSGEIAARRARRILPAIRDTATLSFIVADGTRVEQDEVIARFNTEELQLKIDKITQEIADEEVALQDRASQVRMQELEGATQLKIAENELGAAKLGVQKFLLSGAGKLSRQAGLDVRTAETELARKQKRMADLEGLLKQGFITEDEVEEGRIELDAAQVKLETARLELDAVARFTIPVEGTGVSNLLSKAEVELEKIKSSNETLLLTKRYAAELSKRNLETKRRQLQEYQEDIKAYEVRSPSMGIVQHGEPESRWNRETWDVGAQVKMGQVLVTMPDVSELSAVLNIPEAEVSRVKPGQPVEITVDALSGKLFTGTVERVAEVANQQGFFSSGVKEFEVRVTLDSFAGLRPGFSCRAEIITDTAENVVHVPIQAVFREGDGYVVYDVRGVARKVGVGISSITRVQVIDGIKAGDELLLTRPVGKASKKP